MCNHYCTSHCTSFWFIRMIVTNNLLKCPRQFLQVHVSATFVSFYHLKINPFWITEYVRILQYLATYIRILYHSLRLVNFDFIHICLVWMINILTSDTCCYIFLKGNNTVQNWRNLLKCMKTMFWLKKQFGGNWWRLKLEISRAIMTAMDDLLVESLKMS